jgi:lipopolysaccharide/colanic/teichoic acid biosynthesis glycosyltransferase
MHRILDLAAAVTGVILLAPILLVTAIAIKLDSDGPIFIREPKDSTLQVSAHERLPRRHHP